MKTTTTKWLHSLFAAVITGGATSGLSALGIAGAEAAGLKVVQLDIKQLGILTASGAIVGLMAYLKQSPLPPEE
jgi:hypothetical protein